MPGSLIIMPPGVKPVRSPHENADDETIRKMVIEGTNVDEATLTLQDAGMIEPVDASGSRHRTQHPLVRDVVLATIPAAVRRGLQRLAGRYA